MNNENQSFLRQITAQFLAIVLTAITAALITFIQSLIAQTGVCEIPAPSPADAGVLGAVIKSAHSVLLLKHGTMA